MPGIVAGTGLEGVDMEIFLFRLSLIHAAVEKKADMAVSAKASERPGTAYADEVT